MKKKKLKENIKLARPQLLKKFSFKIKKNKLLKGNDKRKAKELEK